MNAVARTVAGTVAVVVAAVVLVGCDGGGTEAGKKQPVQPTTSSLPDGVNTDALIDFQEEMAAGRDATFTATYAYTGAPDAPVRSGTLTLARRGAAAQKSVLAGDADQPSIALLAQQDGTTVCAAPTGPQSWQCYLAASADPDLNLAIGFADLERVLDVYRPAQYWYRFDRSSEEIAGVSARCLTAVPSGVVPLEAVPADVIARAGTKGRFCIAPSGAPLVVQVEGNKAPLSLVASSYSTSVADDDFTPPAAPQAGPPNVQIPEVPERPDVGAREGD